MLARNEPPAHAGPTRSEKNPKQPTQFMFINSSNGGINAKPDKVVRSFVMKSARNKKSWSTRPKSPKTKTAARAEADQAHALEDNKVSWHSARAGLYGSSSIGPSRSDYTRCITSPNNSRSNSISSSYSNTYFHESYIPDQTSPGVESGFELNTSRYALLRQQLLPPQDSFDKKAFSSFGCLVVPLDANAESLLQQCKSAVIKGFGSALIKEQLSKLLRRVLFL
jgi:hypothetical protein